MKLLDLAWMTSVMQQAIEATELQSNIYVGNFAETLALHEAGFIKIDKRKKDPEGNWYAVAIEGKTVAQMTEHFNAVNAAAAAQQAAEQQAAPAPLIDPALAAPAPATEAYAAPAPVLQEYAAPAADLAATAQPQFAADTAAPAAQPTAAQLNNVIGEVLETPQVLNTVPVGDSAIEIVVGVPFIKHVPVGIQRKESTPRTEKYPFLQMADLKRGAIAEGKVDFIPSFHVAGAKTKNFASTVTRANNTYEKSHGVTFRATQAHANDPNGAGVRVYAMSLDQAPARATRKKKDEAEGTQTAETPIA